MRKVFAVIRREFIERVRTRAFVLSTLLLPVFMAIMFVVPGYLMSRDTGSKRIVIVDGTTSDLGRMVEVTLAAARREGKPEGPARYAITRVDAAGREAAVRDSLVPRTGLSRGAADGFTGILMVSDSSLESGRVYYYGNNVGSPADMRELTQAIRPTVIAKRLEAIGVDPAVVMRSVQGISMVSTKVADGKLTGDSGEQTFFLAYGMGFILYLSLLIFGGQVMTSIVEEKNNRIVEILASSLTPFQMMLGKVVGVGTVALFQIGIWAGTATLISTNQRRIMEALGADSAGPIPFAMPQLGADLLVVFLLFFGLGFLLFAAMYAAVGAMCNTVQEAQQAQMPVMMFVLAGFFSVFALIREPNGTAAQVLTYVPLLSPFVTPMRHSISPLPVTEVLLSAAVTVVGMLAIIWVASRIYRVGILMYGKRASFKEMLRWVTAS
jgi:ABC-2 type transport system permease protein